MVKPIAYIETSVISYLTARPSRNLVAYACQITTQDWWQRRREDFDLVTSPLVLEEASSGDSEAARQRLDILSTLDVLAIDSTIEAVAEDLVRSKLLPAKASVDALHIAVAAFHETDFLVTWNCRHLANAELYRRVADHLRINGMHPPVVCTPQELMGDDIYSA